jgi:hypothetical protein
VPRTQAQAIIEDKEVPDYKGVSLVRDLPLAP